jgi:hypothetical protein
MRNVVNEPIARQFCDLLKRAWFFKEMGRTGNDLYLYFATHLITGLFVSLDDDVVLAANDEQRRRLYLG